MKLLIILAIVALSFWWFLRPRKQEPDCPPDKTQNGGCENCPIMQNCTKRDLRDA